MRGQISIEFILIFSALLMLFAGISVNFYQKGRTDLEEGAQLADARRAATLLVDALNSVYSEGIGARQTVEYWVPATSFSWENENGRWVLRVDLGFDTLIFPSLLPAENLLQGRIENSPQRSLHQTTFRYVGPDNLYVSDRILERA
jgi:hypothetical protein